MRSSQRLSSAMSRMAPASSRALPAPVYIHGANLACYYRPDRDQVTLGSGQITAHKDYSPNHNDLNGVAPPDFTQEGRSSRPFITRTGANNGRLTKTSGVTGYASGSGFYAWAVAKQASQNAYAMLLHVITTGGAYDSAHAIRFNIDNHPQVWFHRGGAAQSVVDTPLTSVLGTYYVIEGWLDTSGPTLKIATNFGTPQTMSPGGSTSDVAAQEIHFLNQSSTSEGITGDVYEAGMATQWTAAKQELMRAYFRRYYGF